MNKSETGYYRAELTIRARINDAARALLLRFVPETQLAPYRIRLIPAPSDRHRPPLGAAWFRVERRVAILFWREIGAFRHGDMHGAELAIRSDAIRRRARRLRSVVVARADAAGKVSR
ncbi:hypothetical protein WL92_17015 [Burkholderia multivorans]|uniref:hypothetical protein n=1 Tax=Burkholderia multivorans TaxID=87883 RepID=UPI000757E67E|nr:hypothetical protein [Burkholderia multivorans]KWF62421.1 hypothetical protein WL91_27705 [Burkholderia multivorans]KWF78675.1 hypothetical protein WL92_17015 [Burkholderia multivorans]